MSDTQNILGIFAGRGSLPQLLIQDCQKNNRPFKLFLLESEEYDIDYSAYNPSILPYGSVGHFLDLLHQDNVKELIFVGAVNKPTFATLKVDKKGAMLVAKILANKILGDDAVLRAVVKFFEKEGLKILRVDALLDCIISKKAVLTQTHPTKENLNDIALGMKAIQTFSRFDVGQSVVVGQKQIIAIEAIEGTDEMIKRCQNLAVEYKKNAVLVKMKKRKQSMKADMPTIGVDTVVNCAQSGIAGIAIQANSTLVLDKEAVIEKANILGLFITVI